MTSEREQKDQGNDQGNGGKALLPAAMVIAATAATIGVAILAVGWFVSSVLGRMFSSWF